MKLELTMVIEEGDSGWLVGQIAEIPGVLTQGKTVEETKENLLDALELYREGEEALRDGPGFEERAGETPARTGGDACPTQVW